MAGLRRTLAFLGQRAALASPALRSAPGCVSQFSCLTALPEPRSSASFAAALSMGGSQRRMLLSLVKTAHQSQQHLNRLHGLRSPAGVGPAHQTRSLFNRRSNKSSRGSDSALDVADDYPEDASKQADAYASMMDNGEAREVIKRFESGNYAVNDSCMKHYVAALVDANKLYQTNLTQMLRKSQGGGSGGSSGTGTGGGGGRGFRGGSTGGGGGGGFHGTDQEPFVVEMAEVSMKTQLWRLVRQIIFILILVSAFSQLASGSGIGGLGGNSTDHEVKPEDTNREYTFDDVQGSDEAKEELENVVQFLRNPDEFTRLGGKQTKGVLLTGPPGTGKTLLARAVAGEAGVPFFYCSGSEFDEMFVGVGARRVRELFAAAKKKAPCIIFLDEIDAVGGKRSAKDQQYSKMTLNQLLVELDGFHKEDSVMVVAATNFPEALDPALVRPGRFDTKVTVGLPDLRGRAKILAVHGKDIPIEDAKDSLWKIARGTPGFSGAELANVVNQAALRASVLQREVVDIEILEWAKDKIMMGAERTKAVISPADAKNTAYHEAGHALCAIYSEGALPIYKATIVPRGNALGMVMQLPEDDLNSKTKKEMWADMVVCMGGYAAEEAINGKENVSTGPMSDLQQATSLARRMVANHGFSDKVGAVQYDLQNDVIAPETRLIIDQEVRRLCDKALEDARMILKRHDREHHRLAEALLEYKTLTQEEILQVIKGEKPSMVGR